MFTLNLSKLVDGHDVFPQIGRFHAGVRTMVALEVFGVVVHKTHVFRQVRHVLAAMGTDLSDAVVYCVLVFNQI